MRRRKGRRNLANFENLPVTTQVYELSPEQRACPCCGLERKEIGADESRQIEYYPGHFERLHHVRKKYACPACEHNGDNPRMETATKPETAIEKGMAGPGLLAYIATSKFSEYLPFYRIEDIFARQGFEIPRVTQSVWCGDMADLFEPLWELMGEGVRASHVVGTDDTVMPMLATGKAANARMWVYVGDDDHPYNVFDFTLNRGRDGPKYFLRDYNQVLLADAYGGYNGVVTGNAITRAGCWAHLRRRFIDAEKVAPEIAREACAVRAEHVHLPPLAQGVVDCLGQWDASAATALSREEACLVSAPAREPILPGAVRDAPRQRRRAPASPPHRACGSFRPLVLLAAVPAMAGWSTLRDRPEARVWGVLASLFVGSVPLVLMAWPGICCPAGGCQALLCAPSKRDRPNSVPNQRYPSGLCAMQ